MKIHLRLADRDRKTGIVQAREGGIADDQEIGTGPERSVDDEPQPFMFAFRIEQTKGNMIDPTAKRSEERPVIQVPKRKSRFLDPEPPEVELRKDGISPARRPGDQTLRPTHKVEPTGDLVLDVAGYSVERRVTRR